MQVWKKNLLWLLVNNCPSYSVWQHDNDFPQERNWYSKLYIYFKKQFCQAFSEYSQCFLTNELQWSRLECGFCPCISFPLLFSPLRCSDTAQISPCHPAVKIFRKVQGSQLCSSLSIKFPARMNFKTIWSVKTVFL